FWPLLLAIILGVPRTKIPAAIVMVALLFVCHPFAIPLLAFAGVLAFLLGMRMANDRRCMWSWAAALAAVTGLRIIWFLLADSAYEAHMVSIAILERQFQVAVVGLPLLALGAAYLAGGLVWLSPVAGRWRRGPLVTHVLARMGIVAAGLLLLW